MMSNRTEEQFIREQVRKILLNEVADSVSWSTGNLDPGFDKIMGTLFGPIGDVFKVAKVAFQDTLSITIDQIRYALATDDKKRAEIKQRYRERREKYKGEMEKAYASTKAAFENPDVQMFAFLAAPGVFLGKGLAKQTLGAVGEPLKDVADDYLGGLLGTRDPDKFQMDAAATQNIGDSIKDSLKSLFFQQESLDEIDELERVLKEQEEKKKEPSEAEKQEMAEDYLGRSGMGDKIEGYWEEILEDKQAEIDDLLGERKATLDIITQLSQSEDFKTAANFVNQLKQTGVDLAPQLKEAQGIAKDQISKIQAGGPEAEQIIADLRALPEGKKIPEDAQPEAYQPLIEKGLLSATFGDAVSQARQQGVGDLLGFVAEMSEEDLAKIAKLSSRGKQYSDMIMKFKNDLLAI